MSSFYINRCTLNYNLRHSNFDQFPYFDYSGNQEVFKVWTGKNFVVFRKKNDTEPLTREEILSIQDAQGSTIETPVGGSPVEDIMGKARLQMPLKDI